MNAATPRCLALSMRVGCLLAACLFCPPPAPAAEGNAVFVERFETGPGARWQIQTTLRPPSLKWVAGDAEGKRPGLHFKAVAVEDYIKSRAYAWAQWQVGTAPFELSWDVYLKRALKQQWFVPGVAVALTSAPPGEMDANDVAYTIALQMAGPAASVRQGGLYDFFSEGRVAWSHFRDRRRTPSIGKAGGGVASVDWPMKIPSGQRLRCSIRRNDANTVTFTIDWPALPGDRGRPFWTGTYDLPPEVAKVPLNYVVVKRVPVKKEHVSYPSFVIQGVVSDIQGRLLSAGEPPAVTAAAGQTPVLAGGVELTLRGRHFAEGASVRVGGKPAGAVERASPTELTCRLPDLPAGNEYALEVINPNGLSGLYEPGLTYGRVLKRVRPREVLPGKASEVTVLGAGFGDDTQFTVDGKAAEVIERIDATAVRIRIPAGKAGPAELGARSGRHAFEGKPLFARSPHPYLYFTAEQLPAIREKFAKPMFADYRKRILAVADAHLDANISGNFNASVAALSNLSMAYAFTERDAYKAKVLAWMRQGALGTEYDDFHMMSAAGMAIAYDVMFAEMSAADRVLLEDYLDRMLAGYMNNRNAWFLGGHANFSNTVPVGNSGGLLPGLALMHSTPKAREAVDVAAEKMMLYPQRCISPDGGCREGVQYWDFGLSFHLLAAHALNNATGDDRGLLDHPHLRKNVNFVAKQLGGHGGQYAFCDTRDPFLGGFAICADLGSRYDQPLMLWVADLCARGGEKTRARNIWVPFAFLWRSEKPAPEAFPGVPTLAWLTDMQWGSMRSDAAFIPGLAVGFKGSEGPLTHHKQNDLGSYVLHANGEAYLVDPGYFEKKPTDHTLPLIDGKGPGVTGSRVTEGWEAGPWRHVTLDSTRGYGKAARRVRRLIVMHGKNAVIVLDDLLPAKGKPGKITAQYQTAWPPSIDPDSPGTLTVAGQKGKLRVMHFGHAIRLEATDRTFRSGWHWKKIAKEGPGDWHSLAGTYTAHAASPLVAVAQPVGAEEAFPAPARCTYGKGTVTVQLPGGATVTFKQTDHGWACAKPD